MKIGIFGGTFNPPHIGHINIAKSAEKSGLDTLIIVPSNIPPHKELPSGSALPQERLEMAQLMAKSISACPTYASDIELNRDGKSYTIDTLNILKSQYPNDQLYLIVGADMLFSFENWKSPDKILNLAEILVLQRNDDQYLALSQCANELCLKYNATINIISAPTIEISSTEIRQLLKIGKGQEYLPQAIFEYIKNKNLYIFDFRLYNLRQYVKNTLSEKRYNHVISCETQAALLAEKWGFDVKIAREAAILHDITKEIPYNKQLNLCDEYGIIEEYVQKTPRQIIHAKTGAYFAKVNFGVSKEVQDAIYWHSTGHPNMTMLDKIIFMADMTEATRDYKALETLEKEAFSNLDRAVLLALQTKKSYLEFLNVSPSQDLTDAIDYFENTNL